MIRRTRSRYRACSSSSVSVARPAWNAARSFTRSWISVFKRSFATGPKHGRSVQTELRDGPDGGSVLQADTQRGDVERVTVAARRGRQPEYEGECQRRQERK